MLEIPKQVVLKSFFVLWTFINVNFSPSMTFADSIHFNIFVFPLKFTSRLFFDIFSGVLFCSILFITYEFLVSRIFPVINV